ncbi:putative phosphatase regulatory subunit domain containing protein [Amanita muscaria]
MIAMSLPQSPEISRNANTAGAPLPLIPRRANSASRTNHAKYNSQTHSTNAPFIASNAPGTAASLQSLHPSSSFHLIVPNAPNQVRPEHDAEMAQAVQHKRSQATQNGLVQNTWTWRCDATASTKSPKSNTSCDCKEGYFPEQSISVATQDHTHDTKQARLIRKKSGQLVKPSLKSPSSCLKPDLSVMTLGKSSKSEPSTPTLAKAVHFDTQLEHVKLFLSQQRPLAVSRDGSPTDDTSGTESDFPSFIYGFCNDKKATRAISMHVTNMPLSVNKSLDVALETLSLTSQGSSLTGQVRLRNITYNKVLNVRFTFDNWSTMNEVAGRYLERIDAEFDRFVFNIRLRNLLLEGKKMIFALRYTANGREIWDNNMGQDYIASFSRSFTNTDGGKIELNLGDTSDINPKLDVPHLSNGDTFKWRGCYSPRSNLDEKGVFTDPLAKSSPLPLQDGFESVFKPLRSTPSMSSTSGSKAQLCGASTVLQPQECPVSGNDIPDTPVVSFGSPRDLDCDTFRPTIRVTFDIDDIAFDTVSYTHAVRNHQRSYFDSGWQAPNVKTTPSALSLFNGVTSLPELGYHSLTPWGIERSRSERTLAIPPFGLPSQRAIQGVGSGNSSAILSSQPPITSSF